MVNNIYYVKKNGEHGGHDVSVSPNIRWFVLRSCFKVLFILLPGQLPRSRGCVHLGDTETPKIRYHRPVQKTDDRQILSWRMFTINFSLQLSAFSC